jgi:uncharacterized membrane protein YdjX (TVP38/TMEM64 family)
MIALSGEEPSSDILSSASLEMLPSFDSDDERDGDGVVLPSSSSVPTSMTDYRPSDYALRVCVGVLLLSCLIYVVVDFLGERHIEAALLKIFDWVQRHPFRGAIAVTLCYIVATVLFIPGSILTLSSGFAIGSASENPVIGVFIATTAVFVGASLGSIFSFLLGRYLFRDCVYRLTESYTLFQAIDRALVGNGLKIMILLRLSPLIPYNALDYMSGVTSITLRDYALALIALLPGALMLSFVGASASSLSDSTSTAGNKTVKIITIVSGVVFGGCGVYAASYYSKMELDRILHAQSTNPIQNPSLEDLVESVEVLLPSSEGEIT